MLMVVGGRGLKAKMITPRPPVLPSECMKGPPLGRLVSRQCHHLVGIELPRGPQITPSESCLVSQRKPKTLAASSRTPAIEASAPWGATTDVPAPMETGGAGNGQSWSEQTEAEDNFKRGRPVKHPWSQSRR